MHSNVTIVRRGYEIFWLYLGGIAWVISWLYFAYVDG